jgi:hypothetical protein
LREWEKIAPRVYGRRLVPEQEEKELANLFAAYQARKQEFWRKERGNTKLQISLIQAPDDSISSPEFQAELDHFVKEGRSGRIEIESFDVSSTDGTVGGYIGEFLIPLAQAIGIGGIVVAWLNGRSGRRVELKFGDIEVKAQTPAEIEDLLKLVAKYGGQKPTVDEDHT